MLFDFLEIKAVDFRLDSKVTIDIEKSLIEILKKNQFVEHTKGWQCDFVKVIITPKNVYITHDIPGSKLTVVNNPLISLQDFIHYFKTI